MYGRKGELCLRFGKPAAHGKKSFIHKTPLQGELLMHKWDDLFATHLDSINEIYEYENYTFKMEIDGRNTTYTPDFFLPSENKFIEIKGIHRRDSKLKCDKFRNEFCKEWSYEILYKEDLKKLGIKV